jgi:hypothetical protein
VAATCERLDGELRDHPLDARLLKIHGQQALLGAKLAQSLRLSPRSRYTPRQAGEQVREAKLSRPWETAAGP